MHTRCLSLVWLPPTPRPALSWDLTFLASPRNAILQHPTPHWAASEGAESGNLLFCLSAEKQRSVS